MDLAEPLLRNKLTSVIFQHGEAVITEERSREVLKKRNQNKKKSAPSCQRLSAAFGSLRESLGLLPSSITHTKADLESRSRSVQQLGLGPVSFPKATPHLSNSTNTQFYLVVFVVLLQVDRIRPIKGESYKLQWLHSEP